MFLFTMMIFQCFVKFTGWYWDCNQPSHENCSLDFIGDPQITIAFNTKTWSLFWMIWGSSILGNPWKPPYYVLVEGKIGTVWRKATSSGCFWYCGRLRNPAPVDSWNIYIYIYMIIRWMIMILVGGFSPPLWKMMGWKSVGMMIIYSQYMEK